MHGPALPSFEGLAAAGVGSWWSSSRWLLFVSLANAGRTFAASAAHETAVAVLRKALALHSSMIGPTDSSTVAAQDADSLIEMFDPVVAESFSDLSDSLPPPPSKNQMSTMLVQARADLAVSLIRLSAGRELKALGEVLPTATDRGGAARGRVLLPPSAPALLQEAERALRAALATINKSGMGASTAAHGRVLHTLGQVFRVQSKQAEVDRRGDAAKAFSQAGNILQRHKQFEAAATAFINCGDMLRSLDKYHAAAKAYGNAIKLSKLVRRGDSTLHASNTNHTLRTALYHLSDVLFRLQRVDQASMIYARAVSVDPGPHQKGLFPHLAPLLLQQGNTGQ